MLGTILLAGAVSGGLVAPCEMVEASQGPVIKADVTLVAFDPLFEAMTLTHNPSHYLPLVVRLDSIIDGVEPAKYVLLNYCYSKNQGQEWPLQLRKGSVRLTAVMTRAPYCNSSLEDVLTRVDIDEQTGAKSRSKRLAYLVEEPITAYQGVVPCYEIKAASSSIHR
jgi:hypothetical protein